MPWGMALLKACRAGWQVFLAAESEVFFFVSCFVVSKAGSTPWLRLIAHWHVSAFRDWQKAPKHARVFGFLHPSSGYQVSNTCPELLSQMFDPFLLALRQQQHITQDSTIMTVTNNMKVNRMKKAPSSMGLALGRFCNLSQILWRRLRDSSLASILAVSHTQNTESVQ